MQVIKPKVQQHMTLQDKIRNNSKSYKKNPYKIKIFFINPLKP